MANWKTFKITGREVKNHEVIGDCVCLNIDSWVRVKGTFPSVNFIVVADYPPFNTWQIDDYIEIDLDEMANRSSVAVLKNTSIVRKVSSSEIVRGSNSTVIPSINQNQVNTIIGQINSAINTDERNEYEAKIHVDPNSGKYSGFSLIGRRK